MWNNKAMWTDVKILYTQIWRPYCNNNDIGNNVVARTLCDVRFAIRLVDRTFEFSTFRAKSMSFTLWILYIGQLEVP